MLRFNRILIFILPAVVLILFVNYCVPSQTNKQLRESFNIQGSWRVIKADPVIDYMKDKATIQLAKKNLGGSIIFKRNSFLSNLDVLGGKTIFTQVKYNYQKVNVFKYFDNDTSYVHQYLKYHYDSIIVLNGIPFYNSSINGMDTLYLSIEVLNNNMIHLNHDVCSLFLKRIR